MCQAGSIGSLHYLLINSTHLNMGGTQSTGKGGTSKGGKSKGVPLGVNPSGMPETQKKDRAMLKTTIKWNKDAAVLLNGEFDRFDAVLRRRIHEQSDHITFDDNDRQQMRFTFAGISKQRWCCTKAPQDCNSLIRVVDDTIAEVYVEVSRDALWVQKFQLGEAH